MRDYQHLGDPRAPWPPPQQQQQQQQQRRRQQQQGAARRRDDLAERAAFFVSAVAGTSLLHRSGSQGALSSPAAASAADIGGETQSPSWPRPQQRAREQLGPGGSPPPLPRPASSSAVATPGSRRLRGAGARQPALTEQHQQEWAALQARAGAAVHAAMRPTAAATARGTSPGPLPSGVAVGPTPDHGPYGGSDSEEEYGATRQAADSRGRRVSRQQLAVAADGGCVREAAPAGEGSRRDSDSLDGNRRRRRRRRRRRAAGSPTLSGCAVLPGALNEMAQRIAALEAELEERESSLIEAQISKLALESDNNTLQQALADARRQKAQLEAALMAEPAWPPSASSGHGSDEYEDEIEGGEGGGGAAC